MGIFSRRNYDQGYGSGGGMNSGYGHDNYPPNNRDGTMNQHGYGHNDYNNNQGSGMAMNDRPGHQQNYYNPNHGNNMAATDGRGHHQNDYNPSHGNNNIAAMEGRGRHQNDYNPTHGNNVGVTDGLGHRQNDRTNTHGNGAATNNTFGRNHNDYPGGGSTIPNSHGQNRDNYPGTTGGGFGMTNGHGRNHNNYSNASGNNYPTNNSHGRLRKEKGSSFFSRRKRDHNTYGGNNSGMTKNHGRHQREKRPLFDMESGNFNRRPSFGQWLKMTWLDILTMAIMGAIALGVYEAPPAPSRSFPVTFSDGQIVYPQFAYPVRNEIMPIWEAALLGSLVPIAVILLCQIRIRSFWDTNNAIIGLLYSLIAAAVFQVFIKWLIGGLRPHFLAVCDPDPALLSFGGKGFGNIMFQRNICRGDHDQIDDSLESMPSGQSTAAWAGFLYLYYYLNAKLKVFANYHPAMWKLIVVYAPILGAFLISGALTIDEYHNWYDSLAGAIIGSVMATSAYRMVYPSLFDFRFNHIPLTRHTPFSYGAGEAGAGGFETAVFTHSGGWGYEEAFGGAPFDAAHGLRGQVNGFNTGVHQNSGLHHEKKGDIEHNAGGHREHGDRRTGDNAGVGYGKHGDSEMRNNAGAGLHQRNGDRDGNVNHNTGLGHNTQRLGGRDGDLDHNTGIGHNQRHNGRDGDLDHNTGIGHNQRHSGRDGDLDPNAGVGNNQRLGNRDYNDTGAAGTTAGITHPTTPPGDGRYHHHSRSVERKSLPKEPNNARPVSGEYQGAEGPGTSGNVFN